MKDKHGNEIHVGDYAEVKVAGKVISVDKNVALIKVAGTNAYKSVDIKRVVTDDVTDADQD